MPNKKEFEIPPTEDLMREHGVLNRVLLIYENIIKRLNNKQELPVSALQISLTIIKNFIEKYHEELEETYIFPLFEKNKKELRLIKTLRNQHNKGREVTGKLLELAHLKTQNNRSHRSIKILLQKFIDMYRPHEAREDTVLFPQVHSLISEQEFKELGEKFEALEHKLFGKEGFESIVKQVETIEKELGIYQLDQFTPVLKES